MTLDIKQLKGTERLIRLDCLFDGKPGCVCSHCEASDTIARLAAERDRLKELYDAGCKQWNPVYKVILNERDHLKAALTEIRSLGFGAPTYKLGRNIKKAVEIASKALGDAS